jgi:hypothetical protein
MICGVSLRALLAVLTQRAEMSFTRLFVWEVFFMQITQAKLDLLHKTASQTTLPPATSTHHDGLAQKRR